MTAREGAAHTSLRRIWKMSSVPFRPSLALALLSAAALSASAAAPVGAEPAFAPPVVVLANYDSHHLPRLIQAVRRSGMPPGTPIYFGNYYGSGFAGRKVRVPEPVRSRQIHRVPGGRYAPLFTLAPSTFWRGREVRAGGRAHRGPMPSLRRILHDSASSAYHWGKELGRRFRDHIRRRRAAGVRIDTWQLDEILSNSIGPVGRRVREFGRGALAGVTHGRRQLHDRPLQGIVWVAHRALGLAGHPLDRELTAFWNTVNGAALRVVGEEYVQFGGDPAAVAASAAVPQKTLTRAPDVRGTIAAKYVVGMTPGYLRLPDLGGNVHHRSRRYVMNWRQSFVQARAAIGAAGFAEFNFRSRNSTPAAMGDVLKALAAGVRSERAL